VKLTLREKLHQSLYPKSVEPHPFEVFCRDAAVGAGPVLDYGAGRGSDVTRVLPEGVFVVGADVGRHVRENAHLSAPVVFGGQSLPFQDHSFGLCIMRWVVEHLPEPEATFSEVGRVLRPGGRLVILTSNLCFYAYLIARVIPNRVHPAVVRRVTGRSAKDTFPTYYRANTRSGLRRALERAGFRERVLMGYQRGAGYLDFSAVTLMLGAAYERFVNSTSALEGWRQCLIADFERG